jgi:hypothetical protein
MRGKGFEPARKLLEKISSVSVSFGVIDLLFSKKRVMREIRYTLGFKLEKHLKFFIIGYGNILF